MRIIAAAAVALVILGVAAVASAAGTQDGGPLIVGKDTNYEDSSTVLSNERPPAQSDTFLGVLHVDTLQPDSPAISGESHDGSSAAVAARSRAPGR